jgi:dTDP-4-amino-4,6-dideoxygalactose transaminase
MNDAGPPAHAPVARIRVESTAAHEAAVLGALRAGHLARGPHLEALAVRLAAQFDRRFVILTTNGFSALHLSLRARGLAPGSPVRTAAAGTCFAMVNAIRAAGLTPEFADLEEDSLSLASADGPAAATIAPDHFGRVSAIARAYHPTPGQFLIEDAAQAFFSRRLVRTAADAVVLSFYPTKWMDGIDGGAVLTDDAALHGEMSRLVSYVDQLKDDPVPRFNLAMPNLHAAYALASLGQGDQLVARLRSRFDTLVAAAADCGLAPVRYEDGEVPTRCLVIAASRAHRDRVMAWLAGQGVQASRELLALCPPGTASGYPVAARLIDRTLALPLHPFLSDDEVGHIANALRRGATAGLR